MSVVRFGSSKSPRWKTEQVVLIPHNRSFSPRTPIVAKSFRYYVKMFEFIYTTFPVTAEGKEWFMNFMDYYFSIFTIGGVILHTRCNLLNFLQSAFYQHYSSLFQTKYTLLVLKNPWLLSSRRHLALHLTHPHSRPKSPPVTRHSNIPEHFYCLRAVVKQTL